MSLFQCDKCGVIENTALTFGYVGYTDKNGSFAKMRIDKGLVPGGKYCSLCYNGEWHGKFERETWPLGTCFTDANGNIQHRTAPPAASKPCDTTEIAAARKDKE